MLKGDLTMTPLAPLLLSLAEEESTGCLHISDAEGDEALIYFKSGLVYAVSVPGRRPQLGAKLVSSGALTPEALAEALEAQRTELQGWKLGELLVHLGFVDQPVVEAFVREQVHDAVWDLIRWTEGRWRFRKNEKSREDVAPPMTVHELLTNLRERGVEWEVISTVVHGPTAVPVLSARGGGAPETTLDADAWSMLCKIDGERSVAELARDCGYTLFEAGQVILTLVQAGLVDIEEDVEVSPPAATSDDHLYGASEVSSALAAAFDSDPEQPVVDDEPDDDIAAIARLVSEVAASVRDEEPTPEPEREVASQVSLHPGDDQSFAMSVERVSAALADVLGPAPDVDDPFEVPAELRSKRPSKKKQVVERTPEDERRAALRAAAAAELAAAHALAEALREEQESARRVSAEQEAERLEAEQEAARLAAEEEARLLAAEEVARRLAEEEAARLAAEEEARRLAEEEAARLAAEEVARRLAEEEAARLAAEEEARRLAEEEAARLAAEEEARRLAEEEAARLAAEEEARRLAEEEAARAAAEEEAARLAAEEEAARAAAEEEAARLAAEEEAARLAAEEEAARLAAEEEAARLAAEEEAARAAAEEETRRLAEEEAARLAAEEEAARVAGERAQAEDEAWAEYWTREAEAVAVQEELERLAAEHEAARLAAEEAERAAAAEAERIAAEEAVRAAETASVDRSTATALLSELAQAAVESAPDEPVADEDTPVEPEPAELEPVAVGVGVGVAAAMRDVADTAALLRELSSLGLDDDAPTTPAPAPRVPPRAPAPAADKKKKKRGLFGL